jgi:L-lactate dehydrogenase
VLLVVTDPPDPLADLVRMLGHPRVLSTGTYLDSLRFRFHLARHLGVNPRSVEALILGEHGTSEVFVWSSARVGGTPVHKLLEHAARSWDETRAQIEREVRYANISIIEGIGASQHGIGMVSARIAEIIVRDERAVIPVGSYHPDHQVTLSLPTVLGRKGLLQVIEPELSDDERQALERSAQWTHEAPRHGSDPAVLSRCATGLCREDGLKTEAYRCLAPLELTFRGNLLFLHP